MPPINSKSRKDSTEYENVITSRNNALNFEKYIQENKTLLLNDPLREILLYPSDDVSSVVLPRRWRTVTTAVPDVRTAASCPLLTRQALLSYASSWNLVHYKYTSYSGSYINLPSCLTSIAGHWPPYISTTNGLGSPVTYGGPRSLKVVSAFRMDFLVAITS